MKNQKESDHSAHWLDKKEWNKSVIVLNDAVRTKYACFTIGGSEGKIATGMWRKRFAIEWEKELTEKRNAKYAEIKALQKQLRDLQEELRRVPGGTIEPLPAIQPQSGGGKLEIIDQNKPLRLKIATLKKDLESKKVDFLREFDQEIERVKFACEKLKQKSYAVLGEDRGLAENKLSEKAFGKALQTLDEQSQKDLAKIREVRENTRVKTINNGKAIETLIAGSSIVVGGAGSYKTANIIQPTILHNAYSLCKPSMIVTDPKGELFEKTASFVEKMGYTVYRFNTVNSKFSHSWNLLSIVWEYYYEKYLPAWHERYQLQQLIKEKGEATAEQASRNAELTAILSDTVQKIDDCITTIVLTVYPLPKDGGGSNAYFYRQGQTFMKAFLAMPLDFGIRKEDYTPYACAENAQLYGNNIALMRDMLPPWSISLTNAAELTAENISQDALKSSLSNAFDGMKIFTSQSIKNLTSSSTIVFDDINEKPTIVYVGIDPTNPDGPGCRIGTLFMSMMYQHLNENLAKNGKGTSKGAYIRPVHYIVDEFGNLPKMDFIQKIFSLDRSKNIMALPVIQATQQMRETYGDNKMWELFNSANEIIVCSISDPQFAKTLSERAGTSWRKRVSKSTSHDGHVSTSESMQRESEIEAGDIMNKEKFEYIVFLQNKKPFKFKFNKFWETEWGKWTNTFGQSDNIDYKINLMDHLPLVFETSVSRAIKKMWYDNGEGKYNMRNDVRSSIHKQMESNNIYRFAKNEEVEYYKEYFLKHGYYPCLALDIVLKTTDSKKDFEIDPEKLAESLQPRSHEGMPHAAMRGFVRGFDGVVRRIDGRPIGRNTMNVPPVRTVSGRKVFIPPNDEKDNLEVSFDVGVNPKLNKNESKQLNEALSNKTESKFKKVDTVPPSLKVVRERKDMFKDTPTTKVRPWESRSDKERIMMIINSIKTQGAFSTVQKRFMLRNLDFLLGCRSLAEIKQIYGEYWPEVLKYLEEKEASDILNEIKKQEDKGGFKNV